MKVPFLASSKIAAPPASPPPGLFVKALGAVFGTVISSMDLFYRKYPAMRQVLNMGGWGQWTERNIDEISAFNSSVVWACTRAISDPVGFIPVHLYRRNGTDPDDRTRATEHRLYRLLRSKPNPYCTALNFKQALQAHALTWGNGYAQIKRRSGTGEPLSLHVLHPGRVFPKIDEDGTVYYSLFTNEGPERLAFDQVLHIPGLGFDGLKGYSVIAIGAKHSIGHDLAAAEYGAKFFARGGRVPYLLKHPKKFKDDEEYNIWRERWEKQYGGSQGWHSAVILEGGLEYQPIGFNLEDSQVLATRKWGVPEICRWFMVTPYRAMDLSEAKFNNVENLGIEFLQLTLGYWLTNWEQQISLRLLSDEEQEEYYPEFDRNELMKGDFESRMKGYSTGLQNGFLNIDTVCAKENLPKPPNGAGKAYHIQLNMQTLPGTGEPTAVEKATLARAGVK